MADENRKESLWATLNLLVGPEKRRTRRDLLEDVDEWLEAVRHRIALARAEEKQAIEEQAEEGVGAGKDEQSPGAESRVGSGGVGGSLTPEASAAAASPNKATRGSAKQVRRSDAVKMSSTCSDSESECGQKVRFRSKQPTMKKKPQDLTDMTQMLICSFSHPHVMSRLERLMGTNIVRITDRKYMLELQRRIKEDHVRSVQDRIRAREVDELEREKKLILDGRMSLDEAPQELIDHPVFQISQMIKKYLESNKDHQVPSQANTLSRGASRTWTSSEATRRESVSPSTTDAVTLLGAAPGPGPGSERDALSPTPTVSPSRGSSKSKQSKDESPRSKQSGEEALLPTPATPTKSPSQEAVDDTQQSKTSPVTATTTSLSPTRSRSRSRSRSGQSPESELEPDSPDAQTICKEFQYDEFDPTEDIEKGVMYTQQDYDKLKFETNSVKKMWELETVEELYDMAEEIVREIVGSKMNQNQ